MQNLLNLLELRAFRKEFLLDALQRLEKCGVFWRTPSVSIYRGLDLVRLLDSLLHRIGVLLGKFFLVADNLHGI